MYTLEQCEKQWDEAGRHGTVMERLDRTERWMPYYAWLAGEASRAYSPNETARAFVDRLMRTGHLCSGDSVLDIGAGMGGYTLELARHCGSVTALDPSGPCLEVLSARAASVGLENVRTVERPWERFCPAERYDLVFSAMCPAVCNIEELRRMESLSRRGCCLITVMRGSYDKHRKAMMAELGIRPQGGMTTEALHYYNALYLMGRQPEVTCRTVRSTSRQPVEAALRRDPIYFRVFGVEEGRSIAFLQDYLARNAADGYLEEESCLRLAMICWEAPTESQ